MRKKLARWLGVGLATWLAVVASAWACDATPPDLHARQAGSDIVLSWTGSLAAGDSWAVVRGDLNVLWDSGFNDSPLATVSVAQYTDPGGAADADWDYFRVRCEGPGGNGAWSSLAFKAVRSFDTVADGGGVEFLNYYLVSLPERLGIPDVADTSAPNPCAPAGGVGDGLINADDLLCSWWTSGRGSLMVSAFDADRCSWLDRMILLEDGDCTAAPETLMLGSWTAPLAGGQALKVIVTHPAGSPAARNSAVMVGSADPARPCQVVREPSLGPTGTDCAPRLALLSVPWDGLDRRFGELLCGREGRDWTYTNPPVNTLASACNAGVFNDDPAHRKAVSALGFDNVADGSTETLDDVWFWWGVSSTPLRPSYQFWGPANGALRPTDASVISVSAGHGSTTYCPEHR